MDTKVTLVAKDGKEWMATLASYSSNKRLVRAFLVGYRFVEALSNLNNKLCLVALAFEKDPKNIISTTVVLNLEVLIKVTGT